MIGMNGRMYFYALRTEKFQTRSFSTEIGNRFFTMLVTRNIIIEVCFHILDGKG
jgi:hypothetical protein